MEVVLITGASGLIGSYLTNLLLSKGYEVRHLGRTKKNIPNVKSFVWNIDKKEIESEAITGCNFIVHLAGEGIADERWTEERKKQIINSRINSARLLLAKVKEINVPLQAFISASGINYYGTETTEKIYEEKDSPSNNFIGNCCVLWEKEADGFSSICRVVKYRTSVVLSKEGGALKKVAAPVKLGFGAALGKGSQYVPWIHLADIANLYLFAIENKALTGVYNATTQNDITNKMLTKSIAKVLNKPFFMPNIPAFLIKLIFGEMGSLVLEGSRASNKKIIAAGYSFIFNDIDNALLSIYSKK